MKNVKTPVPAKIRAKNHSSGIVTALVSAAVLALFAPAPVAANPADSAANPKLRLEREFRTLETVLNRYIQNEVMRAGDLEQMNRALYLFMLQNPGVTRILRVNAGGYSVNDVSAGSQRSAPSRNISAQKWFQQVSQTKRPYYNMDAGEHVSLFYAWPLPSSGGAFTGAAAALIDFTAHAALIDNSPPFQITLSGKPFFQHDWEEFDYIEEPLDIRGAEGLTIRTVKPILTRLDPVTQQPRSGEKTGGADEGDDGADEDGSQEQRPAAAAKSKLTEGLSTTHIIAISTLAVLALLLAYSVIAGRADKKKKLVRDEPLPPPKPTENVVIGNMANAGAKTRPDTDTLDTVPEPIIAPVPPPYMPQQQPHQSQHQSQHQQPQQQQLPTPYEFDPDPFINVNANPAGDPYTRWSDARWSGRRDTDKEQQVIIANMLKLIREDFIIMDKKISILSQRITEIEDFIARQ